MTFSSPFFLALVLPPFAGFYFLVPDKWRNGYLLAVSLLFYLWVEPVAIAVMAFLAVASHFLAKKAARHGKVAVASAVILNVAVLAVYKYNGFLIARLNLGIDRFALAAGMSFYVFQLISYVIDVAGGKSPAGTLSNVLLYVSFMPKIPCGPIVRFGEFMEGKAYRKADRGNITAGFHQFFTGLAKKALLADMLARAVDPIFATPTGQIPCAYCWLGAIAYSLQIYFDFSGYSDMAIGLARVFNYRLPVNFDFPYVSHSLQEFWRRWHMSLSFWFRDYIYIPLGGSRRGSLIACANTMVVFLLCGIWHGSLWTFFWWGALHGAVSVLERLGLRKLLAKLPPALSNAYLLLVVVFGWVLFRSPSMGYALGFMRNMVFGNPGCHPADYYVATKFASYGQIFVLATAMAVAYPGAYRLLSALNARSRGALFVAVAVLAYVFAMTGDVTPGIYEGF